MLTRPTFAVNNIQSLGDIVQNQKATLKTLFDKTGSDAKDYLIALCDQLDADFATKIDLANAIISSAFPSGSIGDDALSNAAGQVKDRLSIALTKLMVTGTNLITWADAQTQGGDFSVVDTITSGVPSVGFYAGLLGIPLSGGKILRLTSRTAPYKSYVNVSSGGVWVGWTEQALPPVTGTYTGDGTASRTITLGFRPKSVLLTKEGGQMYASPQGLGGLALDGNDCILNTYPLISIIATGFIVYFNNTNNQYTNYSGYKYLYRVDR